PPGVRVLVDNLIVPYGGVPFFYVLKKLIYQVLNTTNNYEIGSVKEIDRVNLTKRVKQLLKDMPGNLKEEIIFQDLDFSKNKVVSDFAYKCSSTRNYHAHGSKNPKKNNIYETIDLIHVTKILNLVSEFYLMKQIGLDSEVIIKGLFNKKSHQVVLAV
ncbi:HEPN domain-containing protein, partial [Alkalibacterium psychrotolerans]